MKIEKTRYTGIFFGFGFKGKKTVLTKSLDSKSFFDELLFDGYREFNPTRSKLAAAALKGIAEIPIKSDDVVLYLGAAHGYTCSFISDIVGKSGFIFALDFAPRVVRDLVFLCEQRQNIAPILANANKPETYKGRITEVDIIYADIAQKNQIEMLIKNAEYFLKKNGFIILMIKARSINVVESPRKIYAEQIKRLKQNKFKIIDTRELDPYEKDHIAVVARYTG